MQFQITLPRHFESGTHLFEEFRLYPGRQIHTGLHFLLILGQKNDGSGSDPKHVESQSLPSLQNTFISNSPHVTSSGTPYRNIEK